MINMNQCKIWYKKYDKNFNLPKIIIGFYALAFIHLAYIKTSFYIYYTSQGFPYDISWHLTLLTFFALLLLVDFFIKKLRYLKWFYLYVIYVTVVLFQLIFLPNDYPIDFNSDNYTCSMQE